MANFIASAFTFTVDFGNDLKAALLKNPNLDVSEFVKPYFGIPASAPMVVNVTKKAPEKKAPEKKAPAGDKVTCTATTAKGTQCSKCAAKGEVFCSIHLKKNAPKPPSDKKKKKEAKVVPMHNHEPGKKEDGKACEICDTHGDVMNHVEGEFTMDAEEPDDLIQDPDYVLGEEDFED
jgi:hypothetical protein